MTSSYKVAIHHDNDFGYLEYNLETKEIHVQLSDAGKRAEVENYLNTRRTMMIPQKTLMDFIKVEIVPLDNINNLKLALTKLWENTGVLVDWSRPA